MKTTSIFSKCNMVVFKSRLLRYAFNLVTYHKHLSFEIAYQMCNFFNLKKKKKKKKKNAQASVEGNSKQCIQLPQITSVEVTKNLSGQCGGRTHDIRVISTTL